MNYKKVEAFKIGPPKKFWGSSLAFHASTRTDLILCANDNNTSANLLFDTETPSINSKSNCLATKFLQVRRRRLLIPATTYNVSVPLNVAE
jgi:hypothetical protein